jgi:predicted AlkP superfamily pyrophosphatase or phosphodiesterase
MICDAPGYWKPYMPVFMRWPAILVLGALATASGLALAEPAGNDGTAARAGPIVVLITLDGFPARALDDPRLPMPTLRALQAKGAWARTMQPINPTVTWPNHTALISGVNASRHQVMANGLIVLPEDGSAVDVRPWVPRTQLVHVPTLYDALAKQGMTTGQVDWVAIYQAQNVRWELAEKPDANARVSQDLVRDGLVTAAQLSAFDDSSPAWRDQVYTDAGIDILVHHTPNLLLLHLLQTDTLQHGYGPLTPAAYAAYAYADAQVRRVVDAARAAGLLDRITFVLASDHGFATYTHAIHANALLTQLGLLQKTAGKYQGKAWVLAEGGEASVFIRDKAHYRERLAQLTAAFAKVPGVASVHGAQDMPGLGLPVPKDSDQAPDLYLLASPGYAFQPGVDAPLVEDMAGPRGAHGYLNTDSDMQALFIASGAHIRPGTELGDISNLRVAPTLAKLLGVALPDAKQPPLDQALLP